LNKLKNTISLGLLSSNSQHDIQIQNASTALPIFTEAKKFLTYFAYWLQPGMLSGWSVEGRKKIAYKLKLPYEQTPRTNNHLEGLNSALKNLYFRQYQNNGNLMRIDVLAVTLIHSIIPSIL